eukprot:gene12071-12212_t
MSFAAQVDYEQKAQGAFDPAQPTRQDHCCPSSPSTVQSAPSSNIIKPDFSKAQIRSLRRLYPMQSPLMKPAASLQGEYQLLDQLGKGAHGTAFRARHLPSNQLTCIKTVECQQQAQQGQQSELDQKKREVIVLAALQHPNIIRYHDCFSDGSKLYIVMEWADGGDLQGLLQKHMKAGTVMTEEQLLGYFVQVVLALSFIHARGVMHRDLKCSNIFIHNQKLLKLGDFGLVKVLDAPAGPYSSSGSLAGAILSSSGLGTAAAMVSQNAGLMAQSFVGTPNYLAPEVVNCEPYNLKADCWALGCVLYEMAALKPAFKADHIPGVYRMIKRGKLPSLPARYSPALKTLLASLMKKNPNDRPSSAELLQHELLRQVAVALAL